MHKNSAFLFIKYLYEKSLSYFAPIECLLCKKEDEVICKACFKKIQTTTIQKCPICYKKSAQGKTCRSCKSKTYLDGIITANTTTNPNNILKLIHNFKYNRSKKIGIKLSNLTIQAINKHHFPIKEYIITFVPLHWTKKNERGFNQSEILATEIAKNFKKNCIKTIIRKKVTKPQAKLDKKQRIKNIQNAFKIKNKNNRYKNVLVIDDISTTTATLNECAKILKENGAKKVYGATILRKL